MFISDQNCYCYNFVPIPRIFLPGEVIAKPSEPRPARTFVADAPFTITIENRGSVTSLIELNKRRGRIPISDTVLEEAIPPGERIVRNFDPGSYGLRIICPLGQENGCDVWVRIG